MNTKLDTLVASNTFKSASFKPSNQGGIKANVTLKVGRNMVEKTLVLR